MNAPVISSLGPPPDRHAERIVEEMLTYLHRAENHWTQRSAGVLDMNRMGNPTAQVRTVARFEKALGPVVIQTYLKTGKRAKFKLDVVCWCLWDLDKDEASDWEAPRPANACLAVVMHHLTKDHQDSRTPLLITRHACIRLAQRGGVRTVPDLIVALRELWDAVAGLSVNRPDSAWLDAPAAGWLVPIRADGTIAVLGSEDCNGQGRRLVLKTILEPGMTHGRPVEPFIPNYVEHAKLKEQASAFRDHPPQPPAALRERPDAGDHHPGQPADAGIGGAGARR